MPTRDSQGLLAWPHTVLVGLYEEPERPTNAVDYIKRHMGAPTVVDVEAIKAENIQLKGENEQLKKATDVAFASSFSASRSRLRAL